MPDAWNGRFLMQGGGGLDGVLNPALGNVAGAPSALARGFAVVSHDGGHRGASGVDGTFGLDQQARIDYAYNALGQATAKAKEIVETYYGAAPDRSYFMGCSNGGRQGLVASQRFPTSFDGIIAGNPAISFTTLAMDQVWNAQVMARAAPRDADGNPILSRAFSQSDMDLVAGALLQRCDDLDGLADGMINDWRGCDFEPGELQCAAEKSDSCLSAEQVRALREWHEGPRNSQGEMLYGSFPYDTGIAGSAWRGMNLGSSETGAPNAANTTLGATTTRYYALTPPDPDFDIMSFDWDRDVARTHETAAMGNGDATYLQTFVHGGKMIVYTGLSDQGMAAGRLTDWYDRAAADTGETFRDAVSLFLVPGMTHCGGGQATDRFDMLDSIVAWVEEGRAPERILATGAAFPDLSRPLCPYPQVARYEGGDESDAVSFICRE
jgi:feruloyl esterase